MIKFILIVIGLTIIICKPFLIFICGVGFLAWLFLSRPNYFTSLLSHLTTPATEDQGPKSNLSRDKGFTTYEERAEKEMNNTKFKEGFKDDIKWQTLAKKVGKHVEKAKDLEEAAMRAEAQNIKNMR